MQNPNSKFTRNMLLIMILTLMPSLAVYAQYGAGIQGTVKDKTGAVIPGAEITIISLETGRTQKTVTGGEGFYRFSSLMPGKYKVTAERDGFKKTDLESVTVGAEAVSGVDLTMETGQVTESVTVSAESTTGLQTENANVTRAITTREIRELPQVGRDPYELLRLTPGVFGDGARAGNGDSVKLPNSTGPGGSNNSVFQTENQVQISANGQRLSSNNFQIDGVSVNSFNWGGAALVTPNQESVKEIRVLSSSYSAEDGRNSGAQIKVVSQNGANDIHGSAFFKYNSPELNSFNKYGGPNQGPTKVADYIRQFGGSFGGPLPLPRFGQGGRVFTGGKNRSFFFFSYEGLRNNTGNSARGYVETPEFRQLVLQQRPNSVTARVLSTPGIEPRVIGLIPPSCDIFKGGTIPCQVLPNGLDIGSLTGMPGQYVALGGGGLDGIPDIREVVFALPGQNRGNQYNLRLDFTPNERNTITFSTYITRATNLGSDGAGQSRPTGDLPIKPLNTSGTILFTHVFSPTMLNEARFNATRFNYDQTKDAANVNFGIPRVEVEGMPIGERIRFGAPRAESTPGIFAQNIFEFSDTLSKTINNHALKFGAVVRREQDNSDLSGGSRPVYSFTGLFNLANDAPVFEGINTDPRTGDPADAQRYFRTPYYAGFVQDDWKVSSNLTLNLGVRYEYSSPLQETQGRLSNLLLGSVQLFNPTLRTVDEFYKPDRNNFMPRFGFAYSPRSGAFGRLFREDRAVIRGGFGIAYNRIPVAPLNNERGNPPFFARNGICCGNADTPFAGGRIMYATGSSNSLTSYPRNPALVVGINPANGLPNVTDGSIEIYGTPPEVVNPYVYLYSLELQYELGAQFTLTTGYQGSAGHKLIRLVNQRFLFPAPTNNPISAAYFATPDVNSNFNAALVGLSRRFSRGMQLQANYRWSKSIDQLSSEGPGFVTNQTYPQDNSTERGPSDFDVRHYVTVSGLYDLPFFRGSKNIASSLLGGWRVTGVMTYRTGFPFTPVVRGNTSTPGGPTLNPVRPQGYTGPSDIDTSNDAFITGSNFPGGGKQFFTVFKQADGSIAPPGIGRNSFRGPKYFGFDMSFVKETRLPFLHLGEGTNLELRANFFNIFNKLNLQPFDFGSNAAVLGNFDAGAAGSAGTVTNNPDFGKATAGLAGRVIELQARFRF
jgi:carboxypeptidase family protein/TonB-dependent receptor-like protein